MKDMRITEYNEAGTLQMIREEGREEGHKEGNLNRAGRTVSNMQKRGCFFRQDSRDSRTPG